MDRQEMRERVWLLTYEAALRRLGIEPVEAMNIADQAAELLWQRNGPGFMHPPPQR